MGWASVRVDVEVDLSELDQNDIVEHVAADDELVEAVLATQQRIRLRRQGRAASIADYEAAKRDGLIREPSPASSSP